MLKLDSLCVDARVARGRYWWSIVTMCALAICATAPVSASGLLPEAMYWQLDEQAPKDKVRLINGENGKTLIEHLAASDNKAILTELIVPSLAKLPDQRLQNQLLGYLAIEHNRLLSQVLSARGATFKQSLEQLSPALEQGILNTSFGRQILWQLQDFGLVIQSIKAKDLTVFSHNDQPNFDATLVVTVTPLAEP